MLTDILVFARLLFGINLTYVSLLLHARNSFFSSSNTVCTIKGNFQFHIFEIQFFFALKCLQDQVSIFSNTVPSTEHNFIIFLFSFYVNSNFTSQFRMKTKTENTRYIIVYHAWKRLENATNNWQCLT